mgnify:CR=1 FL=1
MLFNLDLPLTNLTHEIISSGRDGENFAIVECTFRVCVINLDLRGAPFASEIAHNPSKCAKRTLLVALLGNVE